MWTIYAAVAAVTATQPGKPRSFNCTAQPEGTFAPIVLTNAHGMKVGDNPPPTPPTFQTAKCQEVMEDPRKVANRESAQKSRDEKRQRLGNDKYRQQHADAERERRRKKKEQAEMAAAAEDLELEHEQLSKIGLRSRTRN